MNMTLQEFQEKVKIKPFLSLVEKQNFIHEVTASCFDERDGMFVVNHFIKELVYGINLIKYYTDFEITEDDKYEDFLQAGIIQFIELELNDKTYNNEAETEIDILKRLLDDTLREEHCVRNSLSSIISKKLDEVIKTLPDIKGLEDLLKKSVKTVNKIKPEIINAFSKDLSKGNLNLNKNQ
jgi:hypothetical protein